MGAIANKTKLWGKRILAFIKPPEAFSKLKITVIVLLLLLALGLICFGIVNSSYYGNKADSIWYKNARAIATDYLRRQTRSPRVKISKEKLHEEILRALGTPNSIPLKARQYQKKANIYGAVGILGLFLLLSLIIYYFGSKRKSALRAPVS